MRRRNSQPDFRLKVLDFLKMGLELQLLSVSIRGSGGRIWYIPSTGPTSVGSRGPDLPLRSRTGRVLRNDAQH